MMILKFIKLWPEFNFGNSVLKLTKAKLLKVLPLTIDRTAQIKPFLVVQRSCDRKS